MAHRVLISDHVTQCLHLLRQAGNDFEESESTNSSILAILKDQQTRFKLWSGNIGAHKKGMSSLDYRVRDSSNVRNQVVRLLEDLTMQTQDVIAIASGEKIPWDQLPDEEQLADDHVSGEVESEDDFPSTELEQILADIIEIIDCLFRLNVAIRNPAPHDRFVEFKATNTSHYEPHDIRHVRSKFGSLGHRLAERLGKAISRRRQYFKYREAHHWKLQQGLDEEDNPGAIEPAQSTVASSIPDHLKEQSAKGPALAPLLEEDRSDEGFSQTSYATTNAATETRQIPPRPEAAYKGAFECPFCFMMIVATTRDSWKKHVYGDLRPYVCLALDCNTPEREFSRRHEWMEHTRQVHWKAYVCPFDCADTFNSSMECEAHLRKRHAEAVNDASRDALVKLAARALDMQRDIPCPLCQEVIKTEKAYWRHVGKHQMQLALFALPSLDSNNDDEGEVNDSEVESEAGSRAFNAEIIDDKSNASDAELEGGDDNSADESDGDKAPAILNDNSDEDGDVAVSPVPDALADYEAVQRHIEGQHIAGLEHYCPRCFSVFDKEAEKNEHVRRIGSDTPCRALSSRDMFAVWKKLYRDPRSVALEGTEASPVVPAKTMAEVREADKGFALAGLLERPEQRRKLGEGMIKLDAERKPAADEGAEKNEETRWRKKLEEEAQLRAEIEARETLEAERQAAEAVRFAEAAVKAEVDKLKERLLEESKARAEKETKRSKDKEPIKFKDAVGRKFSFPFHLCYTWTGMEDLIKRAFEHVEIIGPHVQEGHYDLLGPNDEVILPSVWERVVEPGWSVTMVMWPIDKTPRR